MYLLGLGLLFLSSWYLIKLYRDFNNDPIAKKEVNQAWEEAKKGAKGKNPFAPGRIKNAINSYQSDMRPKDSEKNLEKD